MDGSRMRERGRTRKNRREAVPRRRWCEAGGGGGAEEPGWRRRGRRIGADSPGNVPHGQNLSNLLRLALLNWYGGAYLDADVVVLGPLSGLRNTIGGGGEAARARLFGSRLAGSWSARQRSPPQAPQNRAPGSAACSRQLRQVPSNQPPLCGLGFLAPRARQEDRLCGLGFLAPEKRLHPGWASPQGFTRVGLPRTVAC